MKINPCTTKPATLKSLSKHPRSKRARGVTDEPGAEDDGGAPPARHHGPHADAAQAAQAELEHVPAVVAIVMLTIVSEIKVVYYVAIHK